MSTRSPLFDTVSGYNRLREALQTESQYALFAWLGRRKSNGTQANQVAVPLARVLACGRGVRMLPPTGTFEMRLDPPSTNEARKLTLGFQLDPNLIGRRKVACRTLLIDPDALARLWHQVWCAGRWYDRVPFDSDAARFEFRGEQPWLVEGTPATETRQVAGGFGKCVLRVAAMREGRFATLEEDGPIRVHRNDGSVAELPHKGVPFRAMEVTQDGEHLLTADALGDAHVWKVDGKSRPTVRLPGSGRASAVAALANGRIAVGRLDGSISTYHADGKLESEQNIHSGRVWRLFALPGGFGSWGPDNRLLLHQGQGSVQEAPAMPAPTSIAYHEGAMLLGTGDSRLITWDFTRGASPHADLVSGACGRVTGLTPLPTRRHLLIVNGRPLYSDGAALELPGRGYATTSAVRPNGERLVASGQGTAARVDAVAPDRSAELDLVLRQCFRAEILSSAMSARLLAGLYELRGEVAEDGTCKLEGEVPFLSGTQVTNEELLASVMAVIVLDLPEEAR